MASKSFSSTTSSTLDGFHPRHYSLLSWVGLETLSFLICAMESLGFPPEQVWWMTFPLLDKPKGGYRPILLSPSLIRLWERLRKPALSNFHIRNARKYWALCRGHSSGEAVFEQSLKCEAAQAQKLSVGGFQWDARKYYESFNLLELRN